MNKPTLTFADIASALSKRGIQAQTFGVDGGDAAFSGVSIDSRSVPEGSLFICKGASFKPEYLTAALSCGAAGFLCSSDDVRRLSAAAGAVPYIAVDDIRGAMAIVGAMAYGHPDDRLTVFGITGTKGKSTVAYMLKSILNAAGRTPSILGSIETDDGIEHFESHNTTPEAPDLWRHLFNTLAAERDAIVMEVSSQALKYRRTMDLSLSVGCFLNIGCDHVSPLEHADFDDYFDSKLAMFSQCDTAVVNLNSDHADRIKNAASACRRTVTFGVNRRDADYCASDLQSDATAISFDVTANNEAHRVRLGMKGLFNVDNALAAITMARIADVPWEAIEHGLASIRVPGRMEVVSTPDERIIAIVDYAHNKLSFETLFKSVTEEYPGRKIIAVFGAAGGKAFERRKELPETAGAYADLLIFTEEDPAHERVEDICAQLAANTPAGVAHEIVCDREEAIRRAVEAAGNEPAVLLLLAKGDETRQHRGDDYPLAKSDLAIARELLLGR